MTGGMSSEVTVLTQRDSRKLYFRDDGRIMSPSEHFEMEYIKEKERSPGEAAVLEGLRGLIASPSNG